MQSSSETRKSINSLTSIRALAVMGIVFFHIKYTMPRFFVYSGFDTLQLCCVALFFVQSGFLLSWNYHEKALKIKEFYIRRFSGIYPLHLLTFVVWSFLFLHYWELPIKEKILIGIANLTFTHTIVPGLKFNLGYNPVSWFLADIAFCYILFPFLRNFRAALGVTAVSVLFLLLQIIFHLDQPLNYIFPDFSFFFPLIHISEFCAGILAAHLFRIHYKLKFATFLEFLAIFTIIAAISVDALNYSLPIMQLFYIFILPLFTYVFACEQGVMSQDLAHQRILILLGNASFSIYIWHHLIMHYLGNKIPVNIPPQLAVSGAISVALLTAIISHKFIELPLRKSITGSLSKG